MVYILTSVGLIDIDTTQKLALIEGKEDGI
jgi:hypothetical protein